MRYVHEDDDDDNDDYIQILVIIEKAGEVMEYVFIIACKLAALNYLVDTYAFSSPINYNHNPKCCAPCLSYVYWTKTEPINNWSNWLWTISRSHIISKILFNEIPYTNFGPVQVMVLKTP